MTASFRKVEKADKIGFFALKKMNKNVIIFI